MLLLPREVLTEAREPAWRDAIAEASGLKAEDGDGTPFDRMRHYGRCRPQLAEVGEGAPCPRA